MDGGHPVADATIMIFPVNVASNVQGAITSLLRPATSDAEGKFELTSIRPGAYSITASAPGYVSADDPKVYYRPGDNATITLVKGGVITGKVTNTSGEPVVSVVVRAVKVREANDKPIRARSDLGSQINDSLEMVLGPFKTDDRGIYRIYGLTPGYYQVAAGGRGTQGVSFGGGTAYDRDAPTYYPSSTMETAAELSVIAGDEVANIDIRYREHAGHSIGGTITTSTGPAPQAITVVLTRPNSGVVEATAIVMAGRQNFGFDSLHDGDYVLTAMGTSGNMGMATGSEGIITASVSQPRPVTIRGADVSGINLVIEPLASIAGRVVLETLQDPKQKADCKEFRPITLQATVLSTQDDRIETADAISGPLGAFRDTTPNEKNEFTIGLLQPGTHWLAVQFPAEHLYLKAISMPRAEPDAKPIDAAKNGVRLRSGDKVTGLVVTMREGAARLSGKVVTGADNKPPDVKMRVLLVPAEPEAADDVLRYFQADVSNEGAFSLVNLQPGKYWLVARENNEAEQPVGSRKPLAFDAGGRTALRVEGEASKSAIELTTCQIVSDHRLKYVPMTGPTKPPPKKAAR